MFSSSTLDQTLEIFYECKWLSVSESDLNEKTAPVEGIF